MGSNIYFPPQRPTLKLTRTARAPEFDEAKNADPVPAADPLGESTLEESWRKLHRAHELLAAEQAQLTDERNMLRAREAGVKQREAAVAVREREATEREQLIVAATPLSKPHESDRAPSAVARLTRAPMEIARAMLGGKRQSS